jgi:hypothetical protein
MTLTLKNLFHMEVKHTLVEFLENEWPSYYNPAGVQLYLNTDRSLFMASDYPGIEQPPGITLELFQEFKSLKIFLAEMGLSRLEQLLKLTPGDLLGLYDRGQMNIVCSLEGKVDRELSFRRHERKIWATDILEQIHEVKVNLDKPEDYIAYMAGYYKIIDN